MDNNNNPPQPNQNPEPINPNPEGVNPAQPKVDDVSSAQTDQAPTPNPESTPEPSVEPQAQPTTPEAPEAVDRAAQTIPKKQPADRKKQNRILALVGLVIVAVGVWLYFFSGIFAESGPYGLAKLETYNDPNGVFSFQVPTEHKIITEGDVLSVSHSEGEEADGTLAWTINVQPLVRDQQPEVDEETQLVSEDELRNFSLSFVESFQNIPDSENVRAPQQLQASVVENSNSAYGVAIDGTFFQLNENDVNLFHRNMVIFDETGNTLIMDFLMPESLYSSDYDSYIEDIVYSLAFNG